MNCFKGRTMKLFYYLISSLLFIILNNSSVISQNKNYFTIVINNNDDLEKLNPILKTAENEGGKYKKTYIEQYSLIKNSKGFVTTFLFQKPQKLNSSKLKKFNLRNNLGNLSSENCTFVAKGAMINVFNQLANKIKKDSERFGVDNNTEIIYFDASGSIDVDDNLTIFSNLGDLRLYLEDLMNDKSRIILVYNSFEEKNLEIHVNEPHYDNNDFFIPACLTKEDADFREYYYPIKWTVPDLCGISTWIIFYDRNENEIFKREFDEKKNIKGEDYFWQKDGNDYCFFLKARKLWDLMRRAYNVPSETYLWDNPDAYVSFEIRAKAFNIEALGDRVKFFINCHLEIYENTNCDCD